MGRLGRGLSALVMFALAALFFVAAMESLRLALAPSMPPAASGEGEEPPGAPPAPRRGGYRVPAVSPGPPPGAEPAGADEHADDGGEEPSEGE